MFVMMLSACMNDTDVTVSGSGVTEENSIGTKTVSSAESVQDILTSSHIITEAETRVTRLPSITTERLVTTISEADIQHSMITTNSTTTTSETAAETTATATAVTSTEQTDAVVTAAQTSAYADTSSSDTGVVSMLNEFAASSRKLGEEGKDDAAEYISDSLAASGWRVNKQDFQVYRYSDISNKPHLLRADGAELLGTATNIIAVTQGYDSTKKDIILSAHYDTTSDNIGIIDNGSGTAFLLMAAEALKEKNCDFNVKIVFFDVEEYRMYGSKYYLENLSKSERSRIIANINYDMVGGGQPSIGTSNGCESPLEMYINDFFGGKFALDFRGGSSDSASFMYWQIPAITFLDTSLPHEPNESRELLGKVSDKVYKDMLKDLEVILDSFDADKFSAFKGSCPEVEHKKLPSVSGHYLQALALPSFTLTKSCTKAYPNGISSRRYCEYTDKNGRKYIVEELSEVKSFDEGVRVVPDTFEECVTDGGKAVTDKIGCMKASGDITPDEMRAIWDMMNK